MERSRAIISWQTLTEEQTGAPAEQEDAPDLIRYGQDRDLWRWRLPNSKPINAYIASMPYQLHEWNRLSARRKTQPTAAYSVQCGLALLHSQEQIVTAQAEQTRMMPFNAVGPER